MSETIPPRMSLVEFIDWEAKQTTRYELVDGQPIMMAGGNDFHSSIKVNLVSLLKQRLKGSPCRPYDSDMMVLARKTGNARYPDGSIDCTKNQGRTYLENPSVIFEVLSEGNSFKDMQSRQVDYESIDSVMNYVVIAQDDLFVSVYGRDTAGRLILTDNLSHPEALVVLDCVGISFLLSDLYDDVFPDDQIQEEAQGA